MFIGDFKKEIASSKMGKLFLVRVLLVTLELKFKLRQAWIRQPQQQTQAQIRQR